MVYRFTFVSDEDDAFTRIIDIESDATFLQLHEAIQKCTGYKNDQMSYIGYVYLYFMCKGTICKGNIQKRKRSVPERQNGRFTLCTIKGVTD